MHAIREAGCDAILHLSTGCSGNRAHGAEWYACLALRLEMGSSDCGSTNFDDRVFENSPAFLLDLAEAFCDAGSAPEIECFDASHVVAAMRLPDDGHLADPLRFQFVLGVRGGAPATAEQVVSMRSLLPSDAAWSICAIGRNPLPMNLFVLIADGHVRTGVEDNRLHSKTRLVTSNAELVARSVRIAGGVGRPVAAPAEARKLLRLGAA